MIPDADEPVSFETHIKPMFRQGDRESMQLAFDLWSHDDVSQHADAILGRLQAGTMPCDGAWPQAQVDLFRRWTESGKRSRPTSSQDMVRWRGESSNTTEQCA